MVPCRQNPCSDHDWSDHSAQPRCLGYVIRVTRRALLSHLLQATPLNLTDASEVNGTQLCFTLEPPCETMTKFSYNKQVDFI